MAMEKADDGAENSAKKGEEKSKEKKEKKAKELPPTKVNYASLHWKHICANMLNQSWSRLIKSAQPLGRSVFFDSGYNNNIRDTEDVYELEK